LTLNNPSCGRNQIVRKPAFLVRLTVADFTLLQKLPLKPTVDSHYSNNPIF
jgi:hypothetical protein